MLALFGISIVRCGGKYCVLFCNTERSPFLPSVVTIESALTLMQKPKLSMLSAYIILRIVNPSYIYRLRFFASTLVSSIDVSFILILISHTDIVSSDRLTVSIISQ